METLIYENKLRAIAVELTEENISRLLTFEEMMRDLVKQALDGREAGKAEGDTLNVGQKIFAELYLFGGDEDKFPFEDLNPLIGGIIFDLGRRRQLETREDEKMRYINTQFETEIKPAFPRMTLKEYLKLMDRLDQVNKLYGTYAGEVNRGYYGRVGSEQDLLTFRTTPEPIRLAGEFYLAIRDFGQIINESFKYFVELPDKFLSRQEKELCTVLPPLFRIDFVLPADGTLPMVMEIQVDDSVPGLMAVETAIYTGKRPSEITAPLFIEQIGLGQVPTAIIWVYDIKDGKIVPSLQRFIDQVAEASSGYISCTIVRSDQLSQLRTEGFDYLWNYSYLPAEEVEAFVREKGLKQIAPSPLSIFSSKRMFSLFTQPELSNFWIERLGIDSFKLLTAMLPHTTDISDVGKLRKIVNKGKYVIKTGAQIPGLIDGAKGVFGPWDDYDRLEEVLEEFGFDSLLLQAQEYVRPKQLKVLVRNTRPKLGLLPYSGPNRICATVVGGNVTAVEATISKKEPAKGYQDCVYTAVLPEI